MSEQSIATKAATARPWEIQEGRMLHGYRSWEVFHRNLLRNKGFRVALCYGPDAAANARMILLAVREYENAT